MTTVNEIFRAYGAAFREDHPFLSEHEKKVMRAIESCRTSDLGGRVEVCSQCGHTRMIFNSCRNRHCPQCQFMKKEAWISQKKNEIFPFQYFHAVFTLPHQLLPIAAGNKKAIYTLLFHSVRGTLLGVASEEQYFGAQIGFFSILHTWGQKLNLHPHLHCVIPGGGYSPETKTWIRSPENYFLPIKVLQKRFRSVFLQGLKRLYKQEQLTIRDSLTDPSDFQNLIDNLFGIDWVVYLKESFKNSDSVIKYLARYTHRIAISNHRIIGVENGEVLFSYKDYSDGNKKKILALEVNEFIQRFMNHVVPPRYVRIRYYGLMSNRNKTVNLDLVREYYQIPPKEKEEESPKSWDAIYMSVTGCDPHLCPHCKVGEMITTLVIPGRGGKSPPAISA